MSPPFVSVFLPTHARFKNGLMPQAVESVLRQTHSNFEFFVIDDASSDGSEGYLRTIAARDKRVKHIRHDSNVGLPAYTLAKAYQQASGQYLAFQFDDAEWVPDYLTTLLGMFERQPDACMVYGSVKFESPSKEILRGGAFDLEKMKAANYIGNCGVMLSRRAVELVGWYDPHVVVKRTCDWDLWMRIGKKRLPIYHCDKVVGLEHGEGQADSLGVSVSLYDPITRKYQQTNRDDCLTPKAVAEGRANMFGPADWMDEDERTQVAMLAFEHFVRTRQVDQAADFARQLLGAQFKDDSTALMSAFNWYLTNPKFGKIVNFNKVFTDFCYSSYKCEELSTRYNDLVQRHDSLSSDYDGLLRSLSWRVTKPLREFRRISLTARTK